MLRRIRKRINKLEDEVLKLNDIISSLTPYKENYFKIKDSMQELDEEYNALLSEKTLIDGKIKDLKNENENLISQLEEAEKIINVLKNGKDNTFSKSNANMKKWLHGFYGETYDVKGV